MPITPNHLTTNVSDAVQAAYSTASISPGANRLVLLWAAGRHSTTLQNTPSVSGNGLIWELVAETTFDTVRFCLFKAMGANPTPGAVTMTWPNTLFTASWSIIEFAGASYALRQFVSDASNIQTLTITLSAFSDAINNYAAGGFFARSQFSIIEGSGFTVGGRAELLFLSNLSEYKLGQDTSVEASAPFGFQQVTGGIAVEIALASGGGGGGGQSQGRGTGGGAPRGGGNAFGKGKDKDHGKDKGGGNGPPGTIDKILVGSRSRRRIGTL